MGDATSRAARPPQPRGGVQNAWPPSMSSNLPAKQVGESKSADHHMQLTPADGRVYCQCRYDALSISQAQPEAMC
jgi:hypothetical protein